jgi:hypothetical protein
MDLAHKPKKVTEALKTIYLFSQKKERQIQSHFDAKYGEDEIKTTFHIHNNTDEATFFLWISVVKANEYESFRHPDISAVIDAGEQWIEENLKKGEK